jgi:hypothetical protein
MERMLERVAGLDVHKKTVTVCVRVPGPQRSRAQHVPEFRDHGGRVARVARLAGLLITKLGPATSRPPVFMRVSSQLLVRRGRSRIGH